MIFARETTTVLLTMMQVMETVTMATLRRIVRVARGFNDVRNELHKNAKCVI